MEELLQFLYLTPIGVVKFGSSGAIDLLNPMALSLLMPLTTDGRLEDLFAVLGHLVPDLRQRVEASAGTAGTVIDQRELETHAGGLSVLSLTVNRVNETVCMAVLQDVTRLKKQQSKLFADRQRFRAIFDHIRDYAIYTITLDGTVEEWNQSLYRYAGWLAADVEGRGMSMFFPPEDPARPRIGELLATAGRTGSVETEGPQRKRDGSILWGNTVITALPDEAGNVRGFGVVSRDMTERKRLEDDLKLLATVDPLTGAANRRQGHMGLATELSRQACDREPFAVLMLDIDHFKAINDQWGHAAGDAVLRALVQTCKCTLRPGDMVARWGGEEFLAILPGTDAAAAMSVAERLRLEVANMQVAIPGGGLVGVTVSIGVAEPAGCDANDLLGRSDAALYAAKSGGRNRVVLAA